MTIEGSNARFVQGRRCEDEIVISGVAGRFPDSRDMHRLKENLMNKIDLVTDDDRRWSSDNPEIPQRTGKVDDLNKFDTSFFAVQAKQAQYMDPMGRMLLEHSYEAIIDAGINPRKLRGTNVGVFIAAGASEAESFFFYESSNALGLPGCMRTMLANRISYWLGVTGPSCNVDSACSSGLTAMECAYRAIHGGQCEAALVGAANLCLHPNRSLLFSRLGIISVEGRCRSFDADANGYARSEAIGVVYLQKTKNAKRIYATFVHGKVNSDGFKDEGITFPSSAMQSRLFNEFYEECGLSPSIVSYVEAHGTGTIAGDPQEANAIASVFCSGRKTPLKIGSVKSNIGHTEEASGICSIAKALIAMESGVIPPNLNYNRPREGIEALADGRIKVVTEATPLDGDYVAVNSFGAGGTNAHILLKANPKVKMNNGTPEDDLPRLVLASGRTEEAVRCILGDVENRPVDAEYVRLIHDIHSDNIPGHTYRGYTIVGGNAGKSLLPTNLSNGTKHYTGGKRPVWFVFSGMGSQWTGMGSSLLRFPLFAKAIRDCDAILGPLGLDIYYILTSMDRNIFDNVLNAVVGITAVQIGLFDILKEIGIVPDNIIGHSFGEIGCAYADGCFTAKQTILSAYYRGISLLETDMVRGSMAAVGLGHKEIAELCPPDIEVACHNGPENSTISGPAESIAAFIDELKAKKIFARGVASSNIAYHSRCVAGVEQRLMAYLRTLIPQPKPRSPKWLSTSVPSSEWNTPQARFSSAEYHTNNLVKPVLFEEVSLLIPKDAVTIELAPHGLLQSILRRSLHPDVINVGLMTGGAKDNVAVFLQVLGKLFTAGLQPRVSKLYPDIEFPVSRGTPMLSPLIRWEHSDDWFVPSFDLQDKMKSGGTMAKISLTEDAFKYMAGYVVDGKNFLPATGALTLVWETVAMARGKKASDASVVFEDVKILQSTRIPVGGIVELTLIVQKGNGRFEVAKGDTPIITGTIKLPPDPSLEMMSLGNPEDSEVDEEMSSDDVYKELKFHGYNYSGIFRSIKSATTDFTKGTIVWADNCAAFMDNMLQMSILDDDSRELMVPMEIQKLTIDTKRHHDTLQISETKELTVRRCKKYDVIIAGGFEIRGFKTMALTREQLASEPILEAYHFVANRDNAETTLEDLVTIAVHLTHENHLSSNMKTIEAVDESVETVPLDDLLSIHLANVLSDTPLCQADVTVATAEGQLSENNLPEGITVTQLSKLGSVPVAMLVCGRDLFTNPNPDTLNRLLVTLKDEGFVLALETGNPCELDALVAGNSLEIVLKKRVRNASALLLRKRVKPLNKMTIINVASNTFEWIPQLQSALKQVTETSDTEGQRIILASEKGSENGILGLVRCLRKEPGGEIIRGYFLQDAKAADFSEENTLYADQLKLDLALNVLRENSTWGTYRHLRLPKYVEKPMHHARVDQLVPGDLNSLRWLEGPLVSTSEKKNLAHVAYASINSRDIMLATNKISIDRSINNRLHQECPYGVEYSGVDASGRRIMGLVESRGLSNIVVMDEALVWSVPESWTLEDAATVPYAYATCYNALYLNGKIKKGDKVLINFGSSGVEEAALTLALQEGCEVFTTVGTTEERKFIRDRFPQIAGDHIGSSEDTSFEQLITSSTNQLGVDIVFNSFEDDNTKASIRCLAHGGRFIKIGHHNLAFGSDLSYLEALRREISFHVVMPDKLFQASAEKKSGIAKMLQSGIDSGTVQPLTHTVFSRDVVLGDAFHHLSVRKPIVKGLIRIRNNNESLNVSMAALPRLHCPKDRSYVIIGGLGGIGLELADWLFLRGAKNLVLTSRRGISNGYQSRRIGLWKSYGTNVVAIGGKDVCKSDDCEHILETARKLGTVDAIFNLAGTLKNALMEDQTVGNFEESFSGNAWGTKNLDRVSRKLCPQLRHFVAFSTICCGRGSAGQSNYGMASSMMEKICETRVAEGLPGLAIQWGDIGDVGTVVNNPEGGKYLGMGGSAMQPITSCFTELEKLMNQKVPIVSCMIVADQQTDESKTVTLIDRILNIMSLTNPKTLSMETPLTELGMDSIMTVEIRNALEREYDIVLRDQEIRALNFGKLLIMSEERSA